MEIRGEYRIAAPRRRVWAALNDPAILHQCIQGCETIDRLSETEWNGTVVARLGPVKAKFGIAIALSQLDPPRSYALTAEGSGAAGTATASATVTLTEIDDDTLLSYTARTSLGGKLGEMGSSWIARAARKEADRFFSQLDEILKDMEEDLVEDSDMARVLVAEEVDGSSAVGHVSETIEPPPAPLAAKPALDRPALPPSVWVTGLALVIGGILFIFAR